ncbi:hypothetical protein V6N11_056866 [Hibiscus sabdariffa]|uniref:DUF4283 domain-containing protein n=1 Tax=Hibiscus sabdariffa TaxID=183260 RepID=A0ABR2T536_9ROSI
MVAASRLDPLKSSDSGDRNAKKPRQDDEEPPDDGGRITADVQPLGLTVSPGQLPMDMDHAVPTSSMQTSFKDKLLGSDSTNHSIETEDAFDNDDIEILEGDITLSMVDGIISIEFFERIQSLAAKSLDQTIVVKLLRHRIGYETLRNKMYELWKPKQPFKLMDIENDYFMVTFHSHLDFLHVLTDGPWLVFGHYLTIEPWTIDFSPIKPNSNKVVAWVRFLGLPITLYKRSLLTEIRNCIGCVIKLDYQIEGVAVSLRSYGCLGRP